MALEELKETTAVKKQKVKLRTFKDIRLLGHDAVQIGVTYQSFGTAYGLHLQVKLLFPIARYFLIEETAKKQISQADRRTLVQCTSKEIPLY